MKIKMTFDFRLNILNKVDRLADSLSKKRSAVIERLITSFNAEQAVDDDYLFRLVSKKREFKGERKRFSVSLDEGTYNSFIKNINDYPKSLILMMLCEEIFELPEQEQMNIVFGR